MPEPTPPTITSKNLPPVQQPSVGIPKVEQPLSYEQIEAKPLRSPNFLNLKPKNPNMSLYFGNRAVGEKESGLRYDQLIAMGFRPAKPDEVLTLQGKPVPDSIIRDGRIMYGDLILLIMPRSDYIGATKFNAESAVRRVRKFGQSVTDGRAESQAAEGRVAPTSALGTLTNSRAGREGKVVAYVPPLAELDSKTADNSGVQANLAEK
jgi:hypothetical protein